MSLIPLNFRIWGSICATCWPAAGFSRADVSAVPIGSPVFQTGYIIFDPGVDYLANPLGSLTGINVVLGLDQNSKIQSGVRHGCLNACLNTRFSVSGLTRSLRYSRHQFGRLTFSSVLVILVLPNFRLKNLVPLEFAHTLQVCHLGSSTARGHRVRLGFEGCPIRFVYPNELYRIRDHIFT